MTTGAFVKVSAEFQPTAEQLAEVFWNMDNEAQADFFSALDKLAGINLCFQMAFVVRTIQKRNDRGDYSAMHGFQTMLSHAQGFHESALDYRCWDAKSEIRAMADEARRSFA